MSGTFIALLVYRHHAKQYLCPQVEDVGDAQPEMNERGGGKQIDREMAAAVSGNRQQRQNQCRGDQANLNRRVRLARVGEAEARA
ncbi:hypothetical protein [Novosphingobium sp. P6W]|uniref:hypothetical protein n=1 Tax=Novosphingobium sp. P6W TaxID=1609758 RepID=UPI000A660B59|nr:hypothetical protein [Novosphingobium sp. P6W]